MSDKLYFLAEEEGIYVVRWDFDHSINGIYYNEEGYSPTIGIAKHLHENSCLFRCVLAEELGHHYTSTGNNLPVKCSNYRQEISISRAEYQARKWAALELMPLDMVKKALTAGITEVWELAEEFGVTEDVVRFRMGLPDVRG